MNLLVDNQLPVALARYLGTAGWECVHVREVGLGEASDEVIWEYAKENRMAIITKDEDFQALANRRAESRRRWFGFASAIVERPRCWKHFQEFFRP